MSKSSFQKVLFKKSFSTTHSKCLQPYQFEHTSSRLICAVKQLWLTHVTEHFSVTIDCVRFITRRFPLYTYSMAWSQFLSKLTSYFWKIFFLVLDFASTKHMDVYRPIEEGGASMNPVLDWLFILIWIDCAGTVKTYSTPEYDWDAFDAGVLVSASVIKKILHWKYYLFL